MQDKNVCVSVCPSLTVAMDCVALRTTRYAVLVVGGMGVALRPSRYVVLLGVAERPTRYAVLIGVAQRPTRYAVLIGVAQMAMYAGTIMTVFLTLVLVPLQVPLTLLGEL